MYLTANDRFCLAERDRRLTQPDDTKSEPDEGSTFEPPFAIYDPYD